jgi:hypothetical protein
MAVDLLAFFLGAALLVVLFWAPFAILRKAGYSPWLGLLIAPTTFVGMIVFAFLEWPIEREIAWLRFKQGSSSDDLVGRVESYAVHLENRGEWKSAEEVYEELIKRATSEESRTYYRNCLGRLRDQSLDSA